MPGLKTLYVESEQPRRQVHQCSQLQLYSCNNNNTLTMVKYKPRAGVGAKATILTKMIYPRRVVLDPKQESTVVIKAEAEFEINRKLQKCYTFSVVDDENDLLCHAIQRYVHVFEEGDTEKLFDRSLPGPAPPKTKKIKWRKSKAKKLLHQLIMDGRIPLDDSMRPEDIYQLDEELAEELNKYDYNKFASRFRSLKTKILELDKRADEDLEAFRNYKKNHTPSLYSHKGYVQWQGSTAQELLWKDLDEYLKNPATKPKDLWMSRPEYKDGFPLDAFRDKIKQEIRTEKYLATRKARSEGLKV